MTEPAAAETWIKGALSADAQLTAIVGTRIYAYAAPDNAPYPLVLFGYQGGADRMGVGPLRIWSNMLYTVRGIVEGTSMGGASLTIAERIDAVLHAASGSNINGVVLACVRERPFMMAELSTAGRSFRHNGGIYRLFAQGA